ncbi:MAG: hypothetical protein HN719_08875 [Alphaproteobacteria bacterium]|nr:hypothetical protein [Alphaproteobacteria bacterium]
MSKGGSSQPSGQTVTTTNQDPWAGVQPYLGYGLGEAQNQYRTAPPEFYPHSTVAPFSADTIAAQDAIRQRATAGSPLNAAAQQGALDTLSGSWLGGPRYTEMYNAAVRPATQQFTESVLPGITSQFARAGRLGSNAQQLATERATEAFGRSLADVGAQQYAAERARQNQMISMAPQIAAADYADPTRLLSSGMMQGSKAQQELADQVGRFDFYQQRPRDMLNAYIGQIGGTPANIGTKQVAVPQFTNPTASAMGGALSGAQLANTMGFSPWLGALGGAGMSLLS